MSEMTEQQAGTGFDAVGDNRPSHEPNIDGQPQVDSAAMTTAVEKQPEHDMPEMPAQLTAIAGQLAELTEIATDTRERVLKLESLVETTSKQVGFLPPQVRMLGGKIDGLATSVSEPRYRSVLLSLLSVYDLVDQVLRTGPPPGSSDDHHRNYGVLRSQLRQILELNGLNEIPCEGAFNPELHRAVQTTLVSDPALADRVIEIVRPGFRTEQVVLRFAEVIVGRYENNESNEGPAQSEIQP